jgi:hypothetical protein
MLPDTRQGRYLQECLTEFPAICELKYGVAFDFAAVEKKVEHLRCRTPLSYDDLGKFESDDYWLQRFWIFPPRDRIEQALQKEEFDFWNLPGSNEVETVRKLLYIFKSMELASIILRFIRPEHYSIYSSPIQHMLDIRHGRDLVETYLCYLGNMRQIREHCGFARIADVDMALWVLHEKCFGRHQDAEIARAYREDDFMLRLRVNNLVAPLVEFSEAKLARALIAVKKDLAIVIACHYFEILIRKLAGQYHLEDIDSDVSLEAVIKALPNYGPVDPVRKGLWQNLRQIRNNLFHDGRLPGLRDTQYLIDEVNKLELDINAGIS